MNACKPCNKEFPKEYAFCPICGKPFEDESNPHYWYTRGVELRSNGKVKAAIDAFNKYNQMGDGKDPYSFKALGDLYYQRGEIDASIDNYLKSIQLKDDFPDTYYYLGVSYYRRAKIRKAIENFEKCLQLNPDYVIAYYWLGITYYHVGERNKAVESYTKLLEFNPSSFIANYHLGVNYNADAEYDKAIDHLIKLKDCCSDDAAVLYHLGMAYFDSGKLMEAIKTFKHSIDVNPQDKRSAKMLKYLTDSPDV